MNINLEHVSNMDFVKRCGVKIPNAVIVSGLTQVGDQDEQVIDFLKEYGSIKRTILVDECESEFYQNLIVEYTYGTALETLSGVLPYKYALQDDPSVVYNIRALSGAYQTEISGNITRTYLSELKALAKLSGAEYGHVLKGVMSQISKDIEAMSSVSEEVSFTRAETPSETQLTLTSTEQHPPVLSSDTAHRNDGLPPPHTITINSVGTAPSLSANDMNPPEIQKVVVEHIVRSEAINPHFQPQLRLRSFSGKTPRPNNETDYDTWRSHIELLLNDPNILPLQITRKIVESLLSPAADVVKGLRPNSPPLAFLQLLDSAFGAVEDGGELFARFLNTFQNPGESASAYLHRLQVALNLVVKRGGVAPGELDRHLLKQFCRGCWDSTLLSTLQLEQARSRPPSFAELLLMLRTEEDRQQAKASRMRKHIGATKRVQVQSQSACACAIPKENPQVCPSAIEDLVKQVATLQSQLTSFMAEKRKDRKVTAQRLQSRTPDKTNANMQTQIRTKQMNKPRPWYCFKCGEDGHISSTCTEAPNPALVAEKRKQLEKRLSEWEMKANPGSQLND